MPPQAPFAPNPPWQPIFDRLTKAMPSFHWQSSGLPQWESSDLLRAAKQVGLTPDDALNVVQGMAPSMNALHKAHGVPQKTTP